jgi:hypothetical protein
MQRAFKFSTALASSRNLALQVHMLKGHLNSVLLRLAAEIWHLKVRVLKVNSNTPIMVLYVAYLMQCISALRKLHSEMDENVI